MPVSQILPADILLFEGDDSFIDVAIRQLTNSKITHAALAYQTGVLADAGPTGIALHALTDDPKGRIIHVRRLPKAAQAPGPVLEAARNYLSQGEPFNMPGLLLVGVLLLYKKVTPSPLVRAAVLPILKRLVHGLDEWIQKVRTPGKQAMFCSQFVFTCFQDASDRDPGYGLPIKDGCFSAARTPADSLLARVAAHPATSLFRAAALDAVPPQENPEHAGLSDHHLAKRLLDALEAEEAKLAKAGEAFVEQALAGDGLEEDFVHTVLALDRLLEQISGGTGRAEDRLFLQRQEPYFVAPADLYAHCPSLVAIPAGDMLIDRGEKNLPLMGEAEGSVFSVHPDAPARVQAAPAAR